MQRMPTWQSLYPFAFHELSLGGLRYHYLDEGAGEPLLMVGNEVSGTTSLFRIKGVLAD